MHFLFIVFWWNIFINSRTLTFRALKENKIRKLPQKIFYGLTALQQLWVYRLSFFVTLNTGQVTRRFTCPFRTALLYGIITIPMLSVILKISRFLPAFLKSKKGKRNRNFCSSMTISQSPSRLVFATHWTVYLMSCRCRSFLQTAVTNLIPGYLKYISLT